MDPQHPPIDFSSVDETLLRSPNDIPSLDDDLAHGASSSVNITIPQTVEDVTIPHKSSSGIDYKAVQTLLVDAFQTAGLNVSEHVMTTIVALSHTLGVEPNSMNWFAAGVTYANSVMLQEKLTTSVKDLQIEIRNLQVASSEVQNLSKEFVGKMARNKREILEEMDKTRESVLRAARTLQRPDIQDPIETETANLLDTINTDTVEEVVPPAQPVDPILLSPALTASVSSKAPAELLQSRKIKLMIELGFTSDEVYQLGPKICDQLLTDEMLEKGEAGMTEHEKESMFDELIGLVVELELLC